MNKKKIVFLSAGLGNGHNMAVRAVQEAIEKYYPSHYEFTTIDVLALVGTTLDKIAETSYEKLAKYSKLTYKALFELSDRSSEFGEVLARAGYSLVKPSLKKITDEDPDIIVTCFPFLTKAIARFLKEKNINIPFIQLVTDTGSVHSAWVCDSLEYILVPTIETAFYLESRGICKDKIKVFGFPVRQSFYQKYDKRKIREKLKIKPTEKVVMYFSGAWGAGKILDNIVKLDENLQNTVIFVLCGKNDKLIKVINDTIFQNRVETLGFVDNIPELMSISDLIVSKAGGISTMEIVTMKKPVIISEVFPGQEEPNARFIETMGFGYIEKEPEEIALRAKYILTSSDLERIRHNYEYYHYNEKSDKKVADFIHSLTNSHEPVSHHFLGGILKKV